MGVLVVGALMIGAGYWISLHLHPEARCRVCKGTGRHWGSMYSRSLRGCRSCGGRGRKERLGVRLIGGGRKKLPTPGTRRALSRQGAADINGMRHSVRVLVIAEEAGVGRCPPTPGWMFAHPRRDHRRAPRKAQNYSSGPLM
jgi:hypothetical protein